MLRNGDTFSFTPAPFVASVSGMSEPKVMPQGYVDFLIVSPVHVTATESSKVQPDYPAPPARRSRGCSIASNPPPPPSGPRPERKSCSLVALRAVLRLESHCFRVGVSWYEAKRNLLRDAVRASLDVPTIRLPPTATA